MNGMRVFAIILIAVGGLGVAYGGLSYSGWKHRARKKTGNSPLWAGIAALAVGGGTPFSGKKKRGG